MITYYGSQISPNKVETSEGFLICRNVPIARIGDQTYYAHELQLDGDPNREIMVHRYADDVFDKATIASFEGKPVTNTHPSSGVEPGNFAQLAKGHVQNVRREGDYIVADLYINDKDLINEIQSGQKKEVSCGYLCTYVPDGDGYKQTKIRGNHVAVVQQGRAGHEVAIQDTAAKKTAEEGRTLMSKLKEVLAAFGSVAKDAEPEDIKALAEMTAIAYDAQEAEPVEKPAPEAEPVKKDEPVKKEEKEETKDEMVEKAPKGDDLGTKLDKLIEMVGALASRMAPAKDAKAEEEDVESMVVEDKDDEDDEDDIEDVKNGEFKDGVGMMKAINSISDKKDRARVSRIFLETMAANDSMREIFKAAGESAKAAAEASGRTSYEKACAESESAYAARNPHMMKEVK